jgi:6-phosphogluconolactonase
MNALRLFQLAAVAVPLALTACSANPMSGMGPLPTAASSRTRAGSAVHSAPASASEYLYVENANDTISAFAVAKNGALSEINGSPFASQTNSPGQFAIAIDPKGPYLYTTGSVSQNIAIFSIESGGGLTLASDSTEVGSGAGFMLLSNADKRLYALDEVDGGQIAAYDLEQKGSTLKSISGSPFQITCPGFCDPNPSVAVANGAYMYSIDSYGWYVSAFSISKNGGLTELNSYATGYGPTDAVMTSNGADLYVTNGAAASISGYSVADGVLTSLNGSPFSAGGSPDGIAITPKNQDVYVANYGDGTISGYSVGAGGILSALPGSPFADGSGAGPNAVAIDRAGKHLFVSNGSTQQIAVYAIGVSGALSQIEGSPFSEREGAFSPRGLAIY